LENEVDKLLNSTSIIFGCVGGYIVALLGGWDKCLAALCTFIVLDYLTGVIKGFTTKTASSKIGGIGILKKVMILIVVVIASTLQDLTNNIFPLRDMVIMFYICNEGISLLENISQFIPLPIKLKEVLLQLRDDNNAKYQKTKK